MNTTIKLTVASALAFGAIAAHASISIPLPSSGASDAILFAEVINNTTGSTVASYAGDTGISVSTLIAGLSGSQTVLGSDANLAKLFAADGSGDSVQWAVEGGQYSTAANTTNWKTAGAAQFLTTVTGNNTASKLAGDNTLNLTKWATLSADVATINSNGTSGSSVEGANPATAGVWDVPNPSTTSSAWYGNGPVTNNAVGGTENLYYVTGGGSTGAKVASSTVDTASLSASGLTLSGTGGSAPPPVPLPPAVWLLGSGLLGLAGVARRKSKV